MFCSFFVKEYKMSDKSFIDIFKDELKKRDNPPDLKPSIIGKVAQISPVIVQIEPCRLGILAQHF